MSRRVIKQPNGKFACFSSVVDHFIWYDATEEEARAYLRDEYMEEIEARIDEKMRAAIDSLREEQDFRDQLSTPSDKEQ